MRKVLLLILVLGLAGAAWSVPTISTDEPYPVRGEMIHISAEDETGPVEGAIIQVEYRPNSSTAATETLEPTDESGMTSWTPRDAGLARLSITGPDGPVGTKAISVRFTSFPGGGIGIMIFAGLFLFGGAAFGMTLLLREQKAPVEEPPST